MELHLFVLLRGAVGRILSLCPPTQRCPLPSPQSPPTSVGLWGVSEQPLTCLALPRLPREKIFPSSMSPAQDRCPPHAWEVQGCAKGSCPMGQALQTPPLPISVPPQSPVVALPRGVWHLKPPACLGVGTGDSRGDGKGGQWVQQPDTQHLPPVSQAQGHPVSPPQQTVPVPWGQQTQDGAFLLQAPLLPFGVWLGESHAAHPALPLPGCPHRDQSREHLARGGTPLPTASGCRSRAEVQRFVLISLSKPTKRKFPRGKPLIFECARMRWKPSRWKIPNPVP